MKPYDHHVLSNWIQASEGNYEFRIEGDDRAYQAVSIQCSTNAPVRVHLKPVPQSDAARELAAAAHRMLNHTGGMSRIDAEIALRVALKAYREQAL